MDNRILFSIVIFTGMVFAGSVRIAGADVWTVEQQYWDYEWEQKYQKWVSEEWKPDFFMNPQKATYYQIPHDCADAVYLMRAVFAYENKLPFKIHNKVSKSSQYISHDMKDWDSIKSPVKRFRAFVMYMIDRVGTRSLPYDTFPVALADIRAGDLYVEPGTHSYEITGITDTGVTAIMSSTTPAAPKHMIQLYSFPFFIPQDRVGMSDGYRRFKWPRNIDKPMQQQPGFSNEQYKVAAEADMSYVGFTDQIAKKLQRRPEPLEEKTSRLLQSLCSFAKERVNYVNDGIKKVAEIRKKGKRRCMNRQEYDYYSTPTRDKRLKRFFEEVRHLAYKGGQLKEDEINSQILARAVFHPELPPEVETEMDKFCRLAIYPNDDKKYINLRTLWENIEAGKILSDPHAPFENRWGLSDKTYAATCPTF